MLDLYHRKIDYMRISITDRCHFQCNYCKSDHPQKLNHQDILSYEQLLLIVDQAIQLGIKKFKITGGEPTLRKNYLFFIKELKKRDVEVTLTTNGSLFKKEDLKTLKEIGIEGINFSIDTLDAKEYFLLTKQDCLKQVLENLFYAYYLKIPVKINCVVDNTFTLKRLKQMLAMVKDKKIALRFIELMPLNIEQRNQKMIDIQNYLKQYPIKQYQGKLGNGPAHYYTIEGYQGYIGLIEALHHKFCYQCNRIRLTSTGKLKPCLFYNEMYDLKPYLNNEEQLLLHLKKAIESKPKEHHFEENVSYTKMNEIGG